MTHTREEVLALARAIFGESNLAKVLDALDGYGTESYEREVNRVKLAILRLSEGKTEKLLYWIKAAKVDYRDPLAAQELGPASPPEGSKLQAQAKKLVDRWGNK
jgi:hypothetical protein